MHNFPAPPACFIGRIKELEQINSALECKKVAAIAGIGGIGKTALMLELANRIRPTENCIWLRVRPGWGESDLLGEIISLCSRFRKGSSEFSLENSFEQAVALINSGSVHVFIDDFQHLPAHRADPFLEWALQYLHTGRIILTTRRKLCISPEIRIELHETVLSPLAEEDAVNMMSRFLESHNALSNNFDCLKEIYSKCKGHPYSVKLFLGFLTGSEGSVAELLASQSYRNYLEENLLKNMWDECGRGIQGALDLLSVIRIPVCLSKFEKFTQKSLSSLLNRFLLETTGQGKVLLHDILRDYARNHSVCPPENLHHQAGMFHALSDEPEQQVEAYYHFTEAGHIEKSVDTIISLSRKSIMLGSETRGFFHLVTDALGRCKGYREQDLLQTEIELLIYLRDFKNALHNLSGISDTLLKLYLEGRIHYYTGKHSQSISCLEKALDLELSDNQICDMHTCLGVCYFHLGKVSKAKTHFKKALNADAGPVFRAKACTQYASFLTNSGSLDKALPFFDEAEKLEQESGTIGNLATTLFNRALNHYRSMETEQALHYIDRSAQLSMEFCGEQDMGFTHCQYANVFLQQGDTEKALEHCLRSLELTERFNQTYENLHARCTLCRILNILDRHDEAHSHICKAMDSYRELDGLLQKSRIMLELALTDFFRQHWVRAKNSLEQVYSISADSGFRDLACESAFFLSRMLKDQEKSRTWNRIFLEELSRLAPVFQRFVKWRTLWFDSRLSTGFVSVITRNGIKSIRRKEISFLHEKAGEYEILIDFESEKLYKSGNMVNFFHRKAMVRLLYLLVREPGKIVTAEEFSKKAWHREFSYRDIPSIRKNVSRLRKALYDEKETIILNGSEKGSYYFNRKIEHCIIIKMQ